MRSQVGLYVKKGKVDLIPSNKPKV